MKRSLLSLLCLVFVTIIFAQERVYVPTLKFPANNATSQMPNVIVSWYAISGSLNLQYRFQMDTTKQFNSPLLIDTTQTLITGYQTHELYFGKKYYWRVKAIDNGQTSAWSSVWNFTVFNRVELSAPADTLHDQTTVRAPFTGEILGTVPICTTEDVHMAIQRARAVQRSSAVDGDGPGERLRRASFEEAGMLVGDFANKIAKQFLSYQKPELLLIMAYLHEGPCVFISNANIKHRTQPDLHTLVPACLFLSLPSLSLPSFTSL